MYLQPKKKLCGSSFKLVLLPTECHHKEICLYIRPGCYELLKIKSIEKGASEMDITTLAKTNQCSILLYNYRWLPAGLWAHDTIADQHRMEKPRTVTSSYTCAKQANLGILILGNDQHILAVYMASIYNHVSLYALSLKKREILSSPCGKHFWTPCSFGWGCLQDPLWTSRTLNFEDLCIKKPTTQQQKRWGCKASKDWHEM